MEIGVQRTCPPYPNRRAFACVGRARHSVRADKGHKPSITYTGHRSPEIFGTTKSMAAAEVWDAALPMAPTWVLASVAASPLPRLLQWGWLLAWRSPSE